jgi:hypothetical protein
MLFKEIIAVYSDNHMKPINNLHLVGKAQNYWLLNGRYIQLPLSSET